VTDRQIDRQTHDYGIYHASTASHGNECQLLDRLIIINGDSGCGWYQPTNGLIDQVCMVRGSAAICQ